MEAILQFMEETFRRLLARFERAPPMLMRVVVEEDRPSLGRQLRLSFSNDTQAIIPVPDAVGRRGPHVLRLLEDPNLERHLLSLYSRCYEDHRIETELNEHRRVFEEFARTCNDSAEIAARASRLHELAQHIRRHHRGWHESMNAVPYFLGVDHAGGDGLTTVDLRQQAFINRAEVVEMQREINNTQRALLQAEVDLHLYGTLYEGSQWTERQQRVQAAAVEAEKKGLELLKRNLAPEQLMQYEKDRHFIVVGGETGTRYRIHHGRQMNIDVLDERGGQHHGLCFLPEGGLVAGDCMLAQKIALENFEKKALKVANKIEGDVFEVRRPGPEFVRMIDPRMMDDLLTV